MSDRVQLEWNRSSRGGASFLAAPALIKPGGPFSGIRLTRILSSQAFAMVSYRSFARSADRGRAPSGRRTSGPEGLGTDSDDTDRSAIAQARISSACRSSYLFPLAVGRIQPEFMPPGRASQVPQSICRRPPPWITPGSPAAVSARCYATGFRFHQHVKVDRSQLAVTRPQ
jgi:hypothetical protein